MRIQSKYKWLLLSFVTFYYPPIHNMEGQFPRRFTTFFDARTPFLLFSSPDFIPLIASGPVDRI